MRTTVLLDTKIDKNEALALLDDFADFIETNTGMECEFFVERRDFSSVPTVPDSDGDLKPTDAYRKSLETDVHKRYGDYGTDNIVMWVHEDNFLFKGIWGSNWSYNFYKYSFHLCRWDKDNAANTFGTLYHEWMHSLDTLTRKEVGGDPLNELIKPDWDAMVHGGGVWDYIGRKTGKENIKALKKAAPHIRQAYANRKEKYLEPYKAIQWQVIHLLSTLIARFKGRL